MDPPSRRCPTPCFAASLTTRPFKHDGSCPRRSRINTHEVPILIFPTIICSGWAGIFTFKAMDRRFPSPDWLGDPFIVLLRLLLRFLGRVLLSAMLCFNASGSSAVGRYLEARSGYRFLASKTFHRCPANIPLTNGHCG